MPIRFPSPGHLVWGALLALTFAVPARAGILDFPFCDQYAKNSVYQYQWNLANGCGYGGSGWSADYSYYFDWCMQGNNAYSAQGYQNQRRALLDTCQQAKANTPPAQGQQTATSLSVHTTLGTAQVPAGGATTFQVRVADQLGRAIPNADVQIQLGGGSFDASGTSNIAGRSDAQGLFAATWRTAPASAYTGNMQYAASVTARAGALSGQGNTSLWVIAGAQLNPPGPTVLNVHVGPTALRLQSRLSEDRVAAGGSILFGVHVVDENGRAVPHADVRIELGGGRFASSGSTSATGRSDANGNFSARWHTAPAAAYNGSLAYSASISASLGNLSAQEQKSLWVVAASAPVAFEGTWQVARFGNGQTPAYRAQLRFDAQGHVTGQSAMNGFSTNYSRSGHQAGWVSFGSVQTSYIGGPAAASQEEARLFADLGRSDSYSIEGNQLIFRAGGSTPTLVLVRAS